MILFREKIKHTPNQKINKEFLSAVSRGNIDKINSLLDKEDTDGTILVDVNVQNKNGDIALDNCFREREASKR